MRGAETIATFSYSRWAQLVANPSNYPKMKFYYTYLYIYEKTPSFVNHSLFFLNRRIG